MTFIRYLLMAISFLVLAASCIYIGLNDTIPILGKEYKRPRFVRILCLLLGGIFLGISLRIIWILPRI